MYIIAFDQALRNLACAKAKIGNTIEIETDYLRTSRKESKLETLHKIENWVISQDLEDTIKIGVTERVFIAGKSHVQALLEVKAVVDLTLYKLGYEVADISAVSRSKSSWRSIVGLDCRGLSTKERKQQTLDRFAEFNLKTDHEADALGILIAILLQRGFLDEGHPEVAYKCRGSNDSAQLFKIRNIPKMSKAV